MIYNFRPIELPVTSEPHVMEVIFGTFIQFLYDNIITPIQCLWYPVALKNKKKICYFHI